MLLASLLALSAVACARQPTAPEVKNAWARDTIGSTANAAVFMTISSPMPDRLVAASTPIANKTDLMTIAGSSGMMDMKYLAGIDISPNTPVTLSPTGLHIWLADLKQPLRSGQSFPMFLRFRKAGQQRVMVTVIGAAAAPPRSAMSM